MPEEYYAIKWIDENTARRKTKEVDLLCEIFPVGKFLPEGEVPNNNLWTIKLTGTADLEHHLVEDSSILLKKMAENKCGGGH